MKSPPGRCRPASILTPLALLAAAGCATPGWDGAGIGPGPGAGERPAAFAHAFAHGSYAPVSWWGGPAPSAHVFVDLLSPYGQWLPHPGYGRVFVPSVGAGWRPYTVGHWVDDRRHGRLWRSTEPFGWATSHYGRWGFDSRIGWFWVPDTVFGPHWVQWRGGTTTIGWAALPPPGWERWGVGYHPHAFSGWWVFAPVGYLTSPWLPYHIHRPHPRDWHETRPIARAPAPGVASEAVRRKLQRQMPGEAAPPGAVAGEGQPLPTAAAAAQADAGWRGEARARRQAVAPEEVEALRAGAAARREAWQQLPEAERAIAGEAARARRRAAPFAATPWDAAERAALRPATVDAARVQPEGRQARRAAPPAGAAAAPAALAPAPQPVVAMPAGAAPALPEAPARAMRAPAAERAAAPRPMPSALRPAREAAAASEP